MATQTQDPDLDNLESKPDGSHDDVNLSPAESAAFDQISAGYNDTPKYSPGNARSTRKQSGLDSRTTAKHGGGSSSGSPGVQRTPGTRPGTGNKSLFSRDGDGQAEKPTGRALGDAPSYTPGPSGGGRSGGGLRSVFTKRRAVIGLGFGGLVGGVLGFYLFTVPVLGPFHILSNIWDFNDGPTQDDKGRRRVILMRDFLNGGFREVRLGNRTFRYDDSPLKNKVKNFFNAPTNEGRVGKFVDRARTAGYNFEFDPNLKNANGDFVNRKGGTIDGDPLENIQTAVVDKDGTRIETLDIETGRNLNQADTNRLIGKIGNDVYRKPLIGLAQRRRIQPLVRKATGVDLFKVFWENTKSVFKNASGRFHADVHGWSDGERPSAASVSEDALDEYTTNEDGERVLVEESSPEVKENLAELSGETGEIANNVANGENVRSEVNRVSRRRLSKAAGSGAALSLLVLTVGCVAREQYKDDVLQLYQRFAASLSYFARAVSAAEELVFESWANVEDVGDLMLDFQRDEQSWVVDKETGKTSLETNTLSFADSAAWQRATGAETITGAEADPQNTIDGEPDSVGEDVFETFGKAIDGFPGVGFACGVINNTLFQAVTTLGEFGICAATGGLSCIAKEGAEEILMTVALDKLFSVVAVPDLGILPTVPDQLLAVIDEGANMTNSLDSRTGKPVTNEEYGQEVVSYVQNERKELQEKPFLERMFAFDVKGSLGYKAAVFKTQMSSKPWHNQLSAVFKAPLSGLASLFNVNRASAAGESAICTSINDDGNEDTGGDTENTTCEPFDNYGYQKYSYNDERINLSPIEYEPYALDLFTGQLSSTETQNKYGLSPAATQSKGLDFARGCMGLVIDENTISESSEADISAEVDREKSLLPYNNPDAIDTSAVDNLNTNKPAGNEIKIEGSDPEKATTLNEFYKTLCEDDAAANSELYADVGAYVDMLEGMDTLVEAMSPAEGEADTQFVLDAGNIPELAKKILDHPNINFLAAKQEEQFQQLVDTATVSPFGADDPTRITVPAKLLQILLKMADELSEPLTINSLVREPNGKSNHGNGSAVDIHYNGADERYRFLYDNRVDFTLNELIFQPLPSGTTNLLDGVAHTYNAATQADHYDHIHFSVKRDQ